jgi:aspartate 1-decarboxylase
MQKLYIKMQEMWVDEVDLKKGDKVNIMCLFNAGYFGTDVVIWNDMKELIGESGHVIQINDISICIQFKKFHWAFPFYCLEKVENQKKMITVKGKEYSESTLDLMIKQYVG